MSETGQHPFYWILSMAK